MAAFSGKGWKYTAFDKDIGASAVLQYSIGNTTLAAYAKLSVSKVSVGNKQTSDGKRAEREGGNEGERKEERERERESTRKSEIEIEKGAPNWLPLAFWDRMWTQVPAYR